MSHMGFLFRYFIWHYSKAVGELVHIIGNFIWFFYEFFSISLLCKTFFAPYKRLDEGYGNGFNISRIFEAVIINMLMRLVGVTLRSVLILLGIIFIVLTVVVGFFMLLVWLLAPLLVLFLISYGIKLVTLS